MPVAGADLTRVLRMANPASVANALKNTRILLPQCAGMSLAALRQAVDRGGLTEFGHQR
jgi:hypothetical protein